MTDLNSLMSAQREGWLGDQYVRIYAQSARQHVAALYKFQQFLPNYELWGSWGCDALCLAPNAKMYRIPWIPLSEEHRGEAYASIQALQTALLALYEAAPSYVHFGKEIHFITPLVFGGAPQDPKNIAMIDQAAHAEICGFWNETHVLREPRI